MMNMTLQMMKTTRLNILEMMKRMAIPRILMIFTTTRKVSRRKAKLSIMRTQYQNSNCESFKNNGQ